MRKLVLGMFVSLDGYVSGPKGENDWIFRSGDDATDEWIIDGLSQAGVIAMGSRSFNSMAGYWPTADTPFAAPMNDAPKVVFTKKGIEPGVARAPADGASAGTGASDAPPLGSWANPIIASGDLAEEVARLKAQPGRDIRVLGGAILAQELAAQGLIDEYHLLVCPVALGKGIPLFSALREPLDLKLVSTRAFDAGAIALVYRTA